MSMTTSRASERRSFLSRLTAGAAAFGGIVLSSRSVNAQAPAAGAWRPTRHAQDDWFDQIPGSHRFVFDTTSPAGFGSALLFANNFFIANQSGYGLGNSDIALVIVARHNSTAFAFNEAMWMKYGTAIAEAAGFEDPKTKGRPTSNLFNAAGYGTSLTNYGVTIDALIKRGVHFAVCNMATQRFAGAIATARGVTNDAAYKELAANLIGNAHLVPAGIVAVNRAQERGYAFANGG
jgi:intracellular sulfur oxidation DsrE/DsrF family protein